MAHATAGSSGVPDHSGARFSQPSGVTTTMPTPARLAVTTGSETAAAH